MKAAPLHAAVCKARTISPASASDAPTNTATPSQYKKAGDPVSNSVCPPAAPARRQSSVTNAR